MGPIWDLFKAALGLAVDVSREMVTAYWNFLQRLAKWSIILALILSPLPIIGSLLHFSWMSGLYLAVIGLLMAIWLVAAFPVVMLMRYAYEDIKSIKKTAQLIGGILFWILLLSIYFYLVPVWNYPAAIPLVFIICLILALGFMRFGIGINPKLAIGVVVIILCLVTVSFYMPTSRSAANTFVGWLDGQFAGFITSPLHPAPQLPKRIDYDHISIDRIVFFDPLTAEARVWYYKPDDGRIELFDSAGHHPQYKVKLEPITPDIVAQIKSRLKAEAEKIAQDEKRRRQEAEKIAKAEKTSADVNWPEGKRAIKVKDKSILAEDVEVKYDPGVALLEIFKTDSIDKVSDLVPVIRTLWKHDFACVCSSRTPWDKKENPWYVTSTIIPDCVCTFLVPERYAEIGLNNPYVARFSFYYEAKQSGKYGFNIWHRGNVCRLVIGNSIILQDSPPSNEVWNRQSTKQGVCNLEKGFHRVEFWLVSSLDAFRNDAYFVIKVLTPDAFDALLITKDMMLLKADQKKAAQVD